MSSWSPASSPSRPPAAPVARRGAPAIEVVDPPAAEAGKGQRPSEAYEAWVEHADDKIDFTPGERVTVGFKPARR